MRCNGVHWIGNVHQRVSLRSLALLPVKCVTVLFNVAVSPHKNAISRCNKTSSFYVSSAPNSISPSALVKVIRTKVKTTKYVTIFHKQKRHLTAEIPPYRRLLLLLFIVVAGVKIMTESRWMTFCAHARSKYAPTLTNCKIFHLQENRIKLNTKDQKHYKSYRTVPFYFGNKLHRQLAAHRLWTTWEKQISSHTVNNGNDVQAE